MIFILISGIIIICYAVLITSVSIGWWRLHDFTEIDPSPGVKISLVVAVRNEADTIEAFLNGIFGQDYPSELFEIIIVNDQSIDSSVSLIEILARETGTKNLKLISLEPDDIPGKKSALEKGIRISTGELIVITDADCTAGASWISAIASFYKKYKPQMILGPVRMTDGGSFLGKLQSLEFVSLISSAAGSCNAGFPLLANGANMAFTRYAFKTCGGFTGNQHYPSGDDMFLLMSIKKKFGAKSIRFLPSAEAIVKTPALKRLKPFIHQRLRWVSKSRGYTDPLLIIASVIVYLTNTWLIVAAFSASLFPETVCVFLLFYLLKMIIDIPLMYSYNRFQQSLSLLWFFPFVELLNAIYTLIIGIAGNIGKYEWKGRKISTQARNSGSDFQK